MCPYCATVVQGPPERPETAQPESTALLSAAAADGSPSPAPRRSLPAVKRPKILVVDDDPGILKVISVALKQLPIESDVIEAVDGVEALEAVETKGADLVILDVMMPRMDGFTVCDNLRKDIRTAFLPVLMLTANADQANRTKGYMVGTDDYMSKPFDINDFLARVTRLLRRTYGL
jgi:two-component system response regulator RpaA